MLHAQNQAIEGLNDYWKEVPLQKINIDLDKPYYLAGENMHYAATIINQHNETREEIIYFALSDTKGQFIWQQKDLVINGTSSGVLSLPDNMSQGNYLLHAYTAYLQNFDKDHHFRKIVPVLSINPQNEEKPSPEFKFYTTQNYLVADIPNEILAVSNTTLPKKLNFLVFQDKEIVYSTNKPIINFNPKLGKEYQVKIVYDNDTLNQRYALPQVKKGISILLNEQDQSLTIAKSDGSTFSNSSLLFATWNKILNIEDIIWQNENNTRIELKGKLIPGINYLFVTHGDDAIASQMVYQKPVAKIKDHKLTGKLNNRQKINADFSLSAEISGHVAISINNLETMDTPLKAYVADLVPKDYKFLPDPNLNPQQQLLAYEWKWWQWGDLQNGNDQEKKFARENNLEMIGTITPAADQQTLSLSVPSGNPVFTYTKTNNKGEFYFSNLNFTGNRDYYIKTWGDQEFTISLDKKQQNVDLPAIVLPELQPTSSMQKYREKKLIINKLQETFRPEVKQPGNISGINPANLQDIVIDYDDFYRLDDYLSFPDMEEVMREIVQGVIIRKKRSGYKLRILDRRTKYYFKKEPLVLIDGLPVPPEEVMKLNPVDVYGIAVTRPTGNFYDFGVLGKYGTLMVYTRKRSYRPEVGESYVSGTLQGFTQKNGPIKEEKPEKDMPDFRPLLYWNTVQIPALQDKFSLDFYTSDDSTKYRVKVSGFTQEGERIYETFYFDIN